MISARLKRFDRTLEEAALNLGASHAAVLRTITFPYLRPALIGSAAISFLMSFENFNTTLMLVGADARRQAGPMKLADSKTFVVGNPPALAARPRLFPSEVVAELQTEGARHID